MNKEQFLYWLSGYLEGQIKNDLVLRIREVLDTTLINEACKVTDKSSTQTVIYKNNSGEVNSYGGGSTCPHAFFTPEQLKELKVT